MTDWVSLKRVARLNYGDALNAQTESDGRYPVVGSGGVFGRHALSNFHAPGIVIGRKGSHGSVHWVPDQGFATDTTYFIDRTCTSADLRWLYYVLESVDLRGASQDVGVPGLSRESAYSVPIPAPPSLEEQRRIADFLDAETARIDGLLTRREQQLSTLGERVGALISEALIPGILTAPARRPPWPWLPKSLRDRPLTRLGYVSRLQNGLTVDGQRTLEGDVVTRPYLRVANVQAGMLDLETISEITVSRRVADRSTLRPGDVLMTEGGDLDKLGRGTVWRDEIPGALHQNHVFAIRPDKDRVVPEFLAYMTQTVHGRCYFESTGSRTTNLASTNSYKIMAFPIPLPSVPSQRRIVAWVEEAVGQTERVRALLKLQCSVLRERRQALIAAAVCGQFDVSSASGQGSIA